MNLEELRTVQHKERQKDSLQHLRPTFYRDVGEYIAELEAERDRVAADADDPFSSPHVGRLTDEIETAKDVVEAIYERRMGKLVKQASLAAAGMPADDEGLTAEEADLFSDLVSRIESNKGRVLEVLDGAETTDSASATDAAPTDSTPSSDAREADQTGAPSGADPSDEVPPVPPEEPPVDDMMADGPAATDSSADRVDVADVMGGDGPDPTPSEPPSSASAPGEPSPDRPEADRREPTADGSGDADRVDDAAESRESATAVDRLTVRITQDVGSILGVDDREYTLACDDVVTLPEQNATPLVERDAAEPLE
ncbi:hypothetical protein [Natronobeatus ordinarius]|uniref:hypothetical protein n=1 Tax=Natronobeatus ordinarius TaxID=2963433 RepID=UPI0020CD8A56|nr:hypothetical protein [Natronobeatus ordinarius]